MLPAAWVLVRCDRVETLCLDAEVDCRAKFFTNGTAAVTYYTDIFFSPGGFSMDISTAARNPSAQIVGVGKS